MKLAIRVMSSALIALQVGCSTVEKPIIHPVPLAVFEMDKKSCVGNCEVIFTNKSKDAETFVWDFGDNATSTEKDTKHTFRSPGEYKVVLKATGKGGTVETSQLMVVEKPISKAVISLITVVSVAQQRTNGAEWDNNSEPDLFITVTEKGANTEVYRQPSALAYLNTLRQMYPINHRLAIPISLDVAKEYTMNVFDDDGNTRELMGSVDFKFSDYATTTPAYPTAITKINGTTTISLGLTWER
jgi:hypothetical protein